MVGSLAGASPPLATNCAANHCFDMRAVVLLLIFGLWQVPPLYAITIFRYEDYAAAAVPVLPIRRGIRATKKHVVA